jgi:hypothetical protein
MIAHDRTASLVLTAAFAATALSGACRKQDLSDQAQIGAAVGDVMSSADDAANGSSPTAMLHGLPIHVLPAELGAPLWRRALDGFVTPAYGAACFPYAFSACDSGVRTETFSSCSYGAATIDGSVSLMFSDTAGCALSTVGDSVVRTASFTVTGPYGGTLAVSSPGGGQTLTRTATGFDYAVPGMERVLTGSAGREIFDIATKTTTNLTITGSSRADLTIASGTLVVQHNLAHYSVALTADNLSWSSHCTCAVSGSLAGTVTGGNDDGKAATVKLTGCGTADVTIDGETESVTMDRCAAI